MSFLFRLMLFFYIPFLLAFCLVVGGLAALLASSIPGFICFAIPWLLLLGILLITLVQTIWAARFLLHPIDEGNNPFELQMPRELLQEVYDLVRQVAKERRLPMPHEIRVAADTIAHVFEDGLGRRVLVLGGPCLMLVPENALGGIIAHELGHFAAGDTRLSRMGFRRSRLISSLEESFTRSRAMAINPLVWVVRAYHWLYSLAWAAHSRQQEYRADEHEVAQVGKKEAAATLVFLTVPDRMPGVRFWAIAESSAATGQPLEALFAEQRSRMKAITKSEWAEAYHKSMRVTTGAQDSHPCLRDRLKAIKVSPKKALAFALELNAPPLADRLIAWPAIEKILTERLVFLARTVHEAKLDMGQILLGKSIYR